MSVKPPEPRHSEGDFRKFVAERLKEVNSSENFGRYEKLEYLAQGGMAKVYKAYDPTLGRSVALKFLRLENAELAGRLLAEARAQARIQHDHVCKVYEVGEIDGKSYISMQFIAGKTLYELNGELTQE